MPYKRIYELDSSIIESGITNFMIDHSSFSSAKKTTVDDLKNYLFNKSVVILSDYTVLKEDYILRVSGMTGTTINLTIPTIPNSNSLGYVIKNAGYSTVNILTTELIDGYTSATIAYHNTSINIIPVLDNWIIN